MVLRNVRRSPLRASMTVLTVAVMLAAFIFPRTLVEAQEESVRQTPNNRVVLRSKEGWAGWMPYGYAEQVREQPGVRYACASRWAGLRLPGRDNVFFPSFATEVQPFLSMHQEVVAPPEQRQAFLANERSAFVSQQLATTAVTLPGSGRWRSRASFARSAKALRSAWSGSTTPSSIGGCPRRSKGVSG
jgi:hypothetical protein